MREELAMRIGLTESRVQVRENLNSYFFIKISGLFDSNKPYLVVELYLEYIHKNVHMKAKNYDFSRDTNLTIV